ncbi:MAG: hypothetical protein Q9192_002095 [Flavoplaca navasiana]
MKIVYPSLTAKHQVEPRATDPQKPGPQAPTTRKPVQTIGSKNLPRRQKITLSAKQDNAAKIAFRTKPPAQIVEMGRPIKDIEPNVGSHVLSNKLAFGPDRSFCLSVPLANLNFMYGAIRSKLALS